MKHLLRVVADPEPEGGPGGTCVENLSAVLAAGGLCVGFNSLSRVVKEAALACRVGEKIVWIHCVCGT